MHRLLLWEMTSTISAFDRWSNCCSRLPMPVDQSATSPMQCCNAEAAMELSGNWWNAFFKRAVAGDDCIEKVGREAMINPTFYMNE